MELTREQQDILNGSQGEVMAKVMKSLVMYGETFGADKLVPVTSEYGHTVISFGIGVMKPVYDLYDQLIKAGALSKQKFSADPLPLDKNVPSSFLQDIIFKGIMYSQQSRYEKQLEKLGIMSEDAYTCACYLDEVGNKPKKGDILSWAESSAVVYANSVLGARCNRNSGMLELMGSIVGYAPHFGLLTDDGRRADWIVELKTSKKPEAQLLGSAIGMKVMEQVPYIKGLDKWLGAELTEEFCAYLKDFGAANCVRAFLGEADGETLPRIAQLCCNLDDMTGEDIGHCVRLLLQAGALDAFTAPIYMKKDRPAVLLTCLCRPEQADGMAALLLRHTTTLGVRRTLCERYVLEREAVTVQTEYGPVRAKRASGFGVERTKAEYDDAARVAAEQGVPLRLVQQAVERAAGR